MGRGGGELKGAGGRREEEEGHDTPIERRSLPTPRARDAPGGGETHTSITRKRFIKTRKYITRKRKKVPARHPLGKGKEGRGGRGGKGEERKGKGRDLLAWERGRHKGLNESRTNHRYPCRTDWDN